MSPLNCIQELAPPGEHYPWRVMVTCILLNQTHGRQVRPMMAKLWEIVPEPQRMMNLGPGETVQLMDLLRPLGFVNRRFHALHRMTRNYLDGVEPEYCYGMGKYGRDALAIFVHGRTDVEPTDTWLKPYLEWRKAGGPAHDWRKRE